MTTRPRLLPGVDVRRSGERFATDVDGISSRHSFSFGTHYDPSNVGYGVLTAHNEEVLAPASGFAPHPHRDVEIVTWVTQGVLRHEDSGGWRGLVRPGQVQRLGAGSGVVHSEVNGETSGHTRFVQAWVRPDVPGLAPEYEQAPVEASGGDLVALASGLARHRGLAVLGLRNRDAALHLGRPLVGREVPLPDAPYLHVFVTSGHVLVEGVGRLDRGDAARLTASGGRRVTTSASGAEVLVWEMHAGL